MAWRRPGDKPLSEPMMASLLLTHICVTRPQWVKQSHHDDITYKTLRVSKILSLAHQVTSKTLVNIDSIWDFWHHRIKIRLCRYVIRSTRFPYLGESAARAAVSLAATDFQTSLGESAARMLVDRITWQQFYHCTKPLWSNIIFHFIPPELLVSLLVPIVLPHIGRICLSISIVNHTYEFSRMLSWKVYERVSHESLLRIHRNGLLY